MKQCKICGKAVVARGYCKVHYRAFMRYGDPAHKQNLRGVPFDNRYTKDPVSGCWNWFGGKDSSGYGTYAHKGGTKAHRYSWERANGRKIPEGYCVLHRCDNPACVNPDHLFLGSHAANMKDKARRGRVVCPIKLNKEHTARAVEMRRQGQQVKDIALHFNMSPSHMSRILKQNYRKLDQ